MARLMNRSQGITRSISAKNPSRRVVLFLSFQASEENVVCFTWLPTSPIVFTAHFIGHSLHPVQSFPRC